MESKPAVSPEQYDQEFQENLKLKQRNRIANRLGGYRPPTSLTIPKFKAIQEKCLELGLLIADECPDCEEKSTAITLLVQVKMMANAAVAIYSPAPQITYQAHAETPPEPTPAECSAASGQHVDPLKGVDATPH